MNGIWLISYLGLWAVVIFALLTIFVLVRQVGLLHRRMGPAVARMENEGPGIGEIIPEMRAFDFEGREIAVGGHRSLQTLLVFLSATCPTCQELAPALRSISKSERNSLELVMVTVDRDERVNRDFISRHKLRDIPLIVSQSLALQLSVVSPPYGVLLDETGEVRAKGVVNHLEHIESLINAARSGYPTIQKWKEAQHERNGLLTIEALPDTRQAHENAAT